MIRLEQARVNNLSLNKFKTMGEDFLFEIKKEIMGDSELAIEHQFFKLFTDESNSATAAIKQVKCVIKVVHLFCFHFLQSNFKIKIFYL